MKRNLKHVSRFAGLAFVGLNLTWQFVDQGLEQTVSDAFARSRKTLLTKSGTEASTIATVKPVLRFAALSDHDAPTPDPTIAVGDSHIVVAVNSKLAIYDKNATPLFETKLDEWFKRRLAGAHSNSAPVEPRLFYDHQNRRWLLAALAYVDNRPDTLSYILLAASKNSNPQGDWRVWEFNASLPGTGNSHLVARDLAIGYGAGFFFLSTNHYQSQTFRAAKVRAVALAQLAQEGPIDWKDMGSFTAGSEPAFSVVPAISYDANSAKTYFIGTERISGKELFLWVVTPQSGNILRVKIPLRDSYTRPTSAPQLSNPNFLLTGDTRVYSAIVRNSVLWCAFTTGGVDISPLGSHIRVLGLADGDTVFDRTDTINEVWNFMPTLAQDKKGNLGIIHYRSADDRFPMVEMFLTASDKNASFPEAETQLGASSSAFNPTTALAETWGMRSGIALDPSDGLTFWGIGELVHEQNAKQWTTIVGAASRYQPDWKITCLADTLRVVRGVLKVAPLQLENIDSAFAPQTKVTAYYSRDAKKSSEDFPLGSAALGFINAHKVATHDYSFTIGVQPTDTSGFLLFIVDEDNDVAEPEDSTNNIFACPVTIRTDSLQCTLAFQSPSEATAICDDSVDVQLAKIIKGGIPPREILRCELNQQLLNCADSIIIARVSVKSGVNTLSAKLVIRDQAGTICSTQVQRTVIADTSPPQIKLRYSPFYPYIKGTASDSSIGIQSLNSIVLRNFNFSVDPFSPGVVSVNFRLDPNPNSTGQYSFLISATNRAGCKTVIDPLLLRMNGSPTREPHTFTVPRVEHFFNLENHGLQTLILETGNTKLTFMADADRQGREGKTYFIPPHGGFTVDLAELWQEEELNVTFTPLGAPQEYAYLIFSDAPWDFSNVLEEPPSAAAAPKSFALLPSFPNPFNPATKIRFDVAEGNERVVSLRIYNMQGQLVKTLVNGWVAAGEYELDWRGNDNNNAPVSSGVYFSVLQAGAYRATRKMTLLH